MMNLTIKNITRIALTVIFAIIISAMSISAATIMVTNTNSGAGSLRQTIIDADAADSADTIVFDSSFNTARMITLTTGDMGIVNDAGTLSITGPGANLLTINGNNQSSFFTTFNWLKPKDL